MTIYTFKLYPNITDKVRTLSLQCPDQLAAIEQAELYRSTCRNVEIWQLDRLIAEVNCSGVIKMLAEPSLAPHTDSPGA